MNPIKFLEDHAHELHEHAEEAIVHAHEGGMWERYMSLLTDPAHILFEITISILFDVIIVYLGYQLIVKKLIIPKLRRDIHRELDAEHHIEHHDHVEGDESKSCTPLPSQDDASNKNKD